MADPSQPHTLSFLATGTGGGKVRVHSDGKEMAAADFDAGPKGARVTIPFKVDPLAKWNVIQWEGGSSWMLDALNISMGGKALEFGLPGEAEVALDAGSGKGNVFLHGADPPLLRYAVTGAVVGAGLQVRTTNLYGETASHVERVPVSRRGEFTPPMADPARPFGSFRAEAWMERDGDRISPIAEVVYHVVPKPVHWGRIAPESRFGNHFHAYEPHLYAAKAIGMNWNRFHGGNAGDATYWSAVEPEKGRWQWPDGLLRKYRDAHFALCGVWVRAPGWARSGSTTGGSPATSPSSAHT